MASEGAGARLRLFHFSDSHVGDAVRSDDWVWYKHGRFSLLVGGPASRRDEDLFLAAFRAAITKRGCAAVIMTGDVAHTGSPQDLRRAAAHTGQVANLAKAVRGNNQWSLLLLPGNHDRYSADGPEPGPAAAFDGVFSVFWDVGRGVKELDVATTPRVCAIAADCSLRPEETLEGGRLGPVTSLARMMGGGRVYNELLRELVARTKNRAHEGWHVIWLIHFAPVFAGLENLDLFLELEEGERLVDAAAKAGVVAILCGHVHRPRRYVYKGVEILAAGNALRSHRDPEASFFEIVFAEQGGALQVVECWEYARPPHSAHCERREFERYVAP